MMLLRTPQQFWLRRKIALTCTESVNETSAPSLSRQVFPRTRMHAVCNADGETAKSVMSRDTNLDTMTTFYAQYFYRVSGRFRVY